MNKKEENANALEALFAYRAPYTPTSTIKAETIGIYSNHRNVGEPINISERIEEDDDWVTDEDEEDD